MPTAMNKQVTSDTKITFQYYDRGIYDTQHWKWRVGCLQGDPSLHANERRITCFRMACPKFCNQFMECYTPYLCGERLRVVPQETCCYCCSNRASWCTNFCGLCGYIDGEPLAISPCAFVGSLIDGEAVKLLYSMSSSRARWLQKSSSSRWNYFWIDQVDEQNIVEWAFILKMSA